MDVLRLFCLGSFAAAAAAAPPGSPPASPGLQCYYQSFLACCTFKGGSITLICLLALSRPPPCTFHPSIPPSSSRFLQPPCSSTHLQLVDEADVLPVSAELARSFGDFIPSPLFSVSLFVPQWGHSGVLPAARARARALHSANVTRNPACV